MSENFAAWTPDEPPDGAVDAPEMAGPGMWLPASVLRRQAAEDAAERREARRAEQEREARREAAAGKALGMYRAAAEGRGEVVSALALATGEGIGRSVADVFADAVAAADHEDARQAARARREAGIEPDHVIVGRSDGWPSSSYEVDRMLRRAHELHRDRIAYEARLASRQGRAGAHIEAQRAEAQAAHAREAQRSAPHAAGERVWVPPGYGEITRVCTPDGNTAWPS